MSGLGLKFQTNQTAATSTPATPATPANAGDAMRAGGGSTERTAPSDASAPHMTSATTSSAGPLSTSQNTSAKRLQVINSLHDVRVGSGITDKREMIQAKVEAVFRQVDFWLDPSQERVDPRPTTTKIFTLPEFFWNDNGANLSVDDKQFALDLIHAQASDPKYENVVFILGSIKTAEPSEHFSLLDDAHLPQIAQKFDLEISNLQQALGRARTNESESYVGPPKDAQRILATIGSLANAHGAASSDPDRAVRVATSNAELMKDFSNPLSLLSAFIREDRLDNQFLQNFLAESDPDSQLALLQDIAKGDLPHSEVLKDLDKLNTLFNRYAPDNAGKLKKLMVAHREHYVPFKLVQTTSSRGRIRADNNQRDDRTALYWSQAPERKPMTTFKQLEQKGASMFKQLRNEAVVMEGGPNGAEKLMAKIFPSAVDDPQFEQTQTKSAKSNRPMYSRAMSHQPLGTHPDMSRDEVRGLSRQHGLGGDHFTFHSPKNDLDVGVVICKDLMTTEYREASSREVARTDLFQLISAKMERTQFEQRASGQTVLSHNDGAGDGSWIVRPGNRGNELGTTFQFDSTHDQYRVASFDGKGPDGKILPLQGDLTLQRLGSVTVGPVIHREGAAPSSPDSHRSDPNPGFKNMLVQSLELSHSELSQIEHQLEVIDQMLASIDDITADSLRDQFQLSEEHNQGLQSGSLTVEDVLRNLQEGFSGDQNALRYGIERTETKLEQIQQR